MTNNLIEKHLNLWSPAIYRIVVDGHLAESWSDRLAGMRITQRKRSDQTSETTLVGRLKDQSELSGVLESLYDLHLPILKVEVVSDE